MSSQEISNTALPNEKRKVLDRIQVSLLPEISEERDKIKWLIADHRCNKVCPGGPGKRQRAKEEVVVVVILNQMVMTARVPVINKGRSVKAEYK